MSTSYIESLPERCLELILDHLNLDDFNAILKCSQRLKNIGNEVLRMREIRLHQVLRQNAAPKWRLLHPKDVKKREPSPGQRFGSTLVYLDSSIYLFGGATVNWTTFNDLWRFDLSEKVWSRRITRGTCPPPRASATGIVYKDKLIIIGGFQLYYSIHSKDTSNWDNSPWIYDFTNNEWKMMLVDTSKLTDLEDDGSTRTFEISPYPVGQSYCLMMDDQVILFGGAKALLNQSQGYHRHNPIHPFGLSNDCFSFSISSSEIKEIQIFGGIKPLKRCGHSAMAIDRHKMIILGGNLGPNMKGIGDMWMLTCVENIGDSCVCVCAVSREKDCEWYWTKVTIDTRLQPVTPFVNNATVFSGQNRVTSTLVVLGPRATDDCHHHNNNNVQSAAAVKAARLSLHSVDVTALLLHGRCAQCRGQHAAAVSTAVGGGTEPRVAWTSPDPLPPDSLHAPTIKQGFGVVCGADSVFTYGGLCYKSAYTRPVYLLNDLMVRDNDTEDDRVRGNNDLHQLTFAVSAITL